MTRGEWKFLDRTVRRDGVGFSSWEDRLHWNAMNCGGERRHTDSTANADGCRRRAQASQEPRLRSVMIRLARAAHAEARPAILTWRLWRLPGFKPGPGDSFANIAAEG